MSDLFPYDQLSTPIVPDLSDQIECTTELIGKGGHGSVYKGRWLGAEANATPVTIAIKIIDLVPLRDEAERTKRFKQITRELSLWCSIKNENILPLLGIARINGDTNIPAFVCPWMENGNAKDFCSRNPRFPPMLILYDIINGLHYLHTSQPEIVHGDIKAVNVLINNRCEACLCDFGLSRFLIDNTLWKTTATHAVGTLRWMAPELLSQDECTPTKESDIYAYAMTCYEILSGDIPFKSVSNDMAILLKVTRGQRPNRMESFHCDFMWDIITRCWQQEPEHRLRTEQVLELLRPKVNWKEVEQTLAKIGEKDAALEKVEKEMVALKEEMAFLKEKLAKARMAIHKKKPYIGTNKSLVIGIDVGTTLSGVSYALLEPGKVPRIQPVTRFLGQIEENGCSKVSSVVCYDQDGHVIAAGPETDLEVNPILYEIEGTRRAEWFKLRLRSPCLPAEKRAQLEKIWSPPEPIEEIDDFAEAYDDHEWVNNVLLHIGVGELGEPEPQNKKKIPLPVTDDFKSVVQVFADFLQYLFKSAKEYIIETEGSIDPTFTWSSIERNTYFVLTHPNRWEGKQQSQMRKAAVMAGLVDRSIAADRITFVTEGEASLHFCLEKIPSLYQETCGLLVVDCGGGTIDISAYSQTEKGGYKEITSPDCLLQGSIFVTSRARDYFKGRFKNSHFGSDEDVEAMAREFDKPGGAKRLFGDPNIHYFVKFAHFRETDRKYGISRGIFKVDGAQIAKFFQPAVQDIICAIEKQCSNANGVSVKFVLLTGGFAQSPYLYTKLRNHFKNSDIVVHRPDIEYLNMVVANGAVSYFVDSYASARIAKYFYGLEVNMTFDPADPEHIRRENTKFKNANGGVQIPGGFLTILEKGTTVTEETQFRWTSQMYFTPEELSQWSEFSMTVKCYKGQAASPPQWLDLEPDSFHDACIIRANVTNIKQNIRPDSNGSKQIYRFDFEVVMFFGFTEVKAYIVWKENGEEKRRDAFIVYD